MAILLQPETSIDSTKYLKHSFSHVFRSHQKWNLFLGTFDTDDTIDRKVLVRKERNRISTTFLFLNNHAPRRLFWKGGSSSCGPSRRGSNVGFPLDQWHIIIDDNENYYVPSVPASLQSCHGFGGERQNNNTIDISLSDSSTNNPSP